MTFEDFMKESRMGERYIRCPVEVEIESFSKLAQQPRQGRVCSVKITSMDIQMSSIVVGEVESWTQYHAINK